VDIDVDKALFSPVIRLFKVMKAIAFATYKEWSAYRSHMAVTIFVGPVNFLVQYFIWQAVYSEQSSIGGLSLQQMITYNGVAAVIGYITYNSADWTPQMLIQSGKFMTFILRPVNHVYFALSQMVGHRFLALWIEMLPICAIFVIVFNINLLPVYPIWARISLMRSFLMSFLCQYCIGIVAFWLTKTDGIRRAFLLFKDICAGVVVPLTLFPEALQYILFFMPFQFITYVPIRVFVGSYNLAGITMTIPEIVGVQALAVIAMTLVTRLVWSLGIKRFTGVGA